MSLQPEVIQITAVFPAGNFEGVSKVFRAMQRYSNAV
jgi:hypothetical protein